MVDQKDVVQNVLKSENVAGNGFLAFFCGRALQRDT